ncbi:Anthocyanidin 5,3-O-glucosyltransferase [Apostasia shenzhenica]|uniref:Anthocyanidin 5,3-O-glucosyltransferase n=1 Tax=Apostasia shenzhenica TaxID=1088818 RepID=A0A2I0AY51_9ASPA|nr:Anthocyanidin 5,3-O-glucosyltransferase [Apostasia shenzhenica]
MKSTFMLYTAAGMGHLIPMVELGKLLLRHGVSVTIVVLDFPSCADDQTADSYISGVSAAHPSLLFHRLPPISLPSPPSNPIAAKFDLIRLANPHLLAYLRSAAYVHALIVDSFCHFALDVAAELSLPSYCFFTTSASNLVAFLYLPILLSQTTDSLKDLGLSPLHFPVLRRSIPASDFPASLSDRNSEVSKAFLHCIERLPLAQGILVNSFQSLESPVFRALAEECFSIGRPMPQIYCIGPITAGEVEDTGAGVDRRHEALAWLDAQPAGRVVFLCFGSRVTFPAAQLREIAIGLERSGQRFLWVVRSAGRTEKLERSTEQDLEELLPDGFVERMQGRGLVVKSWGPQVAVLRHEAVGGFVTHCGWNSALEAIVAGVGMIAWPLYAEQRMNMGFLVEEAGLAAEMNGAKEGWVTAAEVEERVRWVIETEEGKQLRERVAAAGESARAALSEGGSSQATMAEFVRSLTTAGGTHH